MSACWTALNIVKMINYKGVLHSEHPQCTQSNPNTLAIFFPTIIACMIVKTPMESTSFEIFMRILPQKKFPLDSEGRRAKAEMLGERIFRVVINVTCSALLYKILL